MMLVDCGELFVLQEGEFVGVVVGCEFGDFIGFDYCDVEFGMGEYYCCGQVGEFCVDDYDVVLGIGVEWGFGWQGLVEFLQRFYGSS